MRNKNIIPILMLVLAVIVAFGVSRWANDAYNAIARSVIFKSGVTLQNNVSIRSGMIDQRNGSATSPVTNYEFYTKELGGVDDCNDAGTIPADTFTENFTQCTATNNYCSTGDSTACSGDVCRQDNRTNLVWSDYLDSGNNHNWFWANNCWQPGSTQNPGVCDSDDDVACQCVKNTSAEATTSCMALGDGNWRLPYQKELMQAYIDGSWGNLPHAGHYYWSATTLSYNTHNAWHTNLSHGYTGYRAKTLTDYTRCVR